MTPSIVSAGVLQASLQDSKSWTAFSNFLCNIFYLPYSFINYDVRRSDKCFIVFEDIRSFSGMFARIIELSVNRYHSQNKSRVRSGV